jgi:hypothetical protein
LSEIISSLRSHIENGDANQFVINRTEEEDDGLNSTLESNAGFGGRIRAIEEAFINPLKDNRIEL